MLHEHILLWASECASGNLFSMGHSVIVADPIPSLPEQDHYCVNCGTSLTYGKFEVIEDNKIEQSVTCEKCQLTNWQDTFILVNRNKSS